MCHTNAYSPMLSEIQFLISRTNRSRYETRISCLCSALSIEFSSQVLSPHHKYLIDNIESLQRYFSS